MKGKAELGKKNRAIIIAELLKNPMTFTQLKQKLGFSPKTLTQHLRTLESENLVKREIHGRFVVYCINEPKTIIELRKQLFLELVNLRIYDSALNGKARTLYYEILKALKDSIEKPEKEAKTTKVMGIEIPKEFKKTTKVMAKTIEIPKEFKGTVKQSITNLYEKPELKETEKPEPKKPYSFSRKRKSE
jgi:DNA-binding transcriptional ArsR family regulator